MTRKFQYKDKAIINWSDTEYLGWRHHCPNGSIVVVKRYVSDDCLAVWTPKNTLIYVWESELTLVTDKQVTGEMF